MIPENFTIIEHCLEQIKVALKEKEWQYDDLAEQLDVSTATIKRMLNGDDIGLDRLITLARICELDVSKVLENAVEQPKEHTYFTKAQDFAFYRYPHLFRFFNELFDGEQTPKELAEKHGLTNASLHVYLSELENIGLIEYDSNFKVRFKVQPPLGFSTESLYLKNEINHYLQQTSDYVLSDNRPEGYYMMVKPMMLSDSTYRSMIDEFNKVINRYAYISEAGLDEAEDKNLFQATLVTHPYSEVPDVPLVNIRKGHFK